MNATYTIDTVSVPLFKKLVANANKKAAKLGVPEYVVTIGSPRLVEFTEKGCLRFRSVTDVSIEGQTPKFAGWKLVGVVSPLVTDSGEILPFITTVPNEVVRSNGQARDPLWCDHCKVRRDRLETFIVRHEDGTEKQVGRNCIADFLGDSRMSPSGLAGLMNTLASISDSVAEWHKGARKFDAESFTAVLATTLAVLRKHNWVSAKEAYLRNNLTSTKSRVWDVLPAFLNRPETADEREIEVWKNTYRMADFDCLPTDADFDKAEEYRQQLAVILDTKEESGQIGDYTIALRILNQTGAVHKKAFGIAVSAIPFVDRELGSTNHIDPVKARLASALKTSKHVGTPKVRQVFTGAMFVENFQTSTGMTVATFLTAEGDVLKLFSHQTLKPGQIVNLKATVVRHDNYKGTNQTVVNRPTIEA